MSKRIVAVLALAILGMFAFGPSTQAAEPVPAATALGSENAALLQSTLNAMGDLLDTIALRVNDAAHPLTAEERVTFSILLGGMSSSLMALDATIEAQAASHGGTSPIAVVPEEGSGIPAPNVPVAPFAPEEPNTVVVAPNNGVNAPVISSDADDTASARESLRDPETVAWILVILAAVVFGIRYFRSRASATSEDAALPTEQPVASANVIPLESAAPQEPQQSEPPVQQ